MTPQITNRGLWGSDAIRWDEEALQAAVVWWLKQQERNGVRFTFAGDMNAGKRGPRAAAAAKATGMRAGEPDLRIYLPVGIGKTPVLFLELKTDRGRLSDAQKLRHDELRELGHRVETVKAATPTGMIANVAAVLEDVGVKLETGL